MKAALKSTWENPNWNMKFLGDKKFGVKKTVDGKEWTWRGDFVADENKNTITLTCKVKLDSISSGAIISSNL